MTYYTNNPVIVTVSTAQLTPTAAQTVAFHRVLLNVGGIVLTHIIATEGESIDIDISSALVALSCDTEFSPTSLAAKTVTASISATEEYMIDNDITTRDATVSMASVTAIIGGLSDLERLKGLNSGNAITTCKPCALAANDDNYTPQVAASDEGVVIGGVAADSSATNVYRLSDSLANLPDRYVFRFVNRYGCIESIGVTSFRETEMNVTKKDYIVSRPETLTSFSRARYTKQNDYETWKLSSGPLDRPWQQWFAHELLMAEHCWLYVGSRWLRVHIIPEETVTLVNRTDGSLLTVTFSVRFDINGSPV